MNSLLENPSVLSNAAHQQLVADNSTLLLCHWQSVLMIHFEVDEKILQPQVPFPLDTRDGKAYVSAVAFTMTNLRPRFGGSLTTFCAKPVSSHEFLNVRTYVRHEGERGIYFLREWLPNRLSVFLAPRIYGLPYQLGVAHYEHNVETGKFNGEMIASDSARLTYSATPEPGSEISTATQNSLEEFLLERYTAFTERNGTRRLFRVWHEPWQYIPLRVEIENDTLLASTGNWFPHASFVAAHFCHDARNVWMSRSQKIVAADVRRQSPPFSRSKTNPNPHRGCHPEGSEGSPLAARDSDAIEMLRFAQHDKLATEGVKRSFTPVDLLPVFALIALAFASQPLLPAWAFMWTLAATMFFSLKWLTLRRALRQSGTQHRSRIIPYLTAWTGMNAEEFLSTPRHATTTRSVEWFAASAKISFGASLLWFAVPFIPTSQPLLAAWIGMTGLIFLLHFGAFHLLSLAWRTFGFNAPPIMRNPIAAKSLSDFWSNRWNLAFRDAAHTLVFRPLRNRLGARGAMFAVFAASGLIHDAVISIPAGGGFGLPTLYFVVQGIGVAFERSALGKRLGLQRGIRGRLFALGVVAAPVFWLFHPPFAQRVILPFLEVIGAWKGVL